MNLHQMQALGRVLDHYGPDEFRHYKDAGNPPSHIAEALLSLQEYRQAHPLKINDLAEGRAKLEEVASRPNDEFAVPDAQDDFDKVQWQILYCLLQSANHPDEVKKFVDDALKVKDANLLRAALRALDSYDMPEIPF